MTEIRDRTFAEGETVDMDGNSFVNCAFIGATLRYQGDEHPSFDACRFDQVGWYFTGAALRTIQLLQGINSGDKSGSQMITDLFRPGNFIGDVEE